MFRQDNIIINQNHEIWLDVYVIIKLYKFNKNYLAIYDWTIVIKIKSYVLVIYFFFVNNKFIELVKPNHTVFTVRKTA